MVQNFTSALVWHGIKDTKYIDKTLARISQLFINTWLSRYPRPHRVVFDNGSEFKRDFVPWLLKAFDVKPVLTSIKTHNPMHLWNECIKYFIIWSWPPRISIVVHSTASIPGVKSSVQLHGQYELHITTQHLIKHLDNMSLDVIWFLTSLQSSTGKQ